MLSDISAVNLMQIWIQGLLRRCDGRNCCDPQVPRAVEPIVITCNDPGRYDGWSNSASSISRICIFWRVRGDVLKRNELLQAGVKHSRVRRFQCAGAGAQGVDFAGYAPHQAQQWAPDALPTAGYANAARADARTHGYGADFPRAEARRELEEIFQREMQQERRQLDGWGTGE